MQDVKIHIGEDLLVGDQVTQLCQDGYAEIAIITDDNVAPLYADALRNHLENSNLYAHVITIPHGEHSKSRETKRFIQDQLFENGFGRDSCVIALGGGMVSDIAGFVAATYCRGVPAIYFPTTLLSMVDAAIGGKTGVNTPCGKNLLGTFTQPKAVISDINTLNTLPDLEYIGAFSEIIKHALVSDSEYFNFLYDNADELKNKDKRALIKTIQKSVEIKSHIVEQDEKENGIREVLNFGHTIGHALEHVCEYTLTHGQCVAIGMIVEGYISKELGFLSDDEFERIKNIIDQYEIPLIINYPMTEDKIRNALLLDKKSRNKTPRFVLLEGIGRVNFSDGKYAASIDEAALNSALDYLMSEFGG